MLHGVISLTWSSARRKRSTKQRLDFVSEEYGAGEEIEVTVTFNYPVVVFVGTVLLIDTGEETTWGEAVYLSGNGTAAVTFLYTVAEGDRSVDLGTFAEGEAEDGGGLIGTVLRNSDHPTQVRRLGDLAATRGHLIMVTEDRRGRATTVLTVECLLSPT